MRILALVPDAFGARGGIAKFNRDLLEVLSASAQTTDIVALPRNYTAERGPGLAKTAFLPAPRPGLFAYARWVARHGLSRRWDLIVVGHLNFLPLAWILAVILRRPMTLVIYGVEAWKPRHRRLTQFFLKRVSSIVAISRFTGDRLVEWAGDNLAPRVRVIPCALDVGDFSPGPKPDYLLERYGLRGRKIILTVARLSAAERYKGVDEVMDALVNLTRVDPSFCYLIVGDGDDAERLRRRASEAGLDGSVVFAGYVPESEKADHYRLADVFAMPGRGEGFGYVYLEALACGVPVIASSADASRETVLDGRLGVVVNPDKLSEIESAIEQLATLGPQRTAPNLAPFSVERFRQHWERLLEELAGETPRVVPKAS